MRQRKRLLTVFSIPLSAFVLGVLSVPPILSAAEPEGAAVGGTVTYNGPKPERAVIDMSRDKKCAELHRGELVLDENVLVNNSGQLQNVFVYIKRGLPRQAEYAVPAQPAVIDQKGCMYRPRVQGVRVGQLLKIVNSDELTHNVRAFPTRNRPFNIGQIGPGTREKTFNRVERNVVEVRCDIHKWMHAYLFVVDHPFYSVTGESGTYSIEGLPPGEYTLAAWHEEFGEQRQQITAGAGVELSVDFTFDVPEKTAAGAAVGR